MAVPPLASSLGVSYMLPAASGRQFHRAADGRPCCIWGGFGLQLLRTADVQGAGCTLPRANMERGNSTSLSI